MKITDFMVDLGDYLVQATADKVKQTWKTIRGKEVECESKGLISYLKIWKDLYLTFKYDGERTVKLVLDNDANNVLESVAGKLSLYGSNSDLKIPTKYENVLERVTVGDVQPSSGLEITILLKSKQNTAGRILSEEKIFAAVYDSAVKPAFGAVI